MLDIRDYYLRYQLIEKQVNDAAFSDMQKPSILSQLKGLLEYAEQLNKRFYNINKKFLNPSEIEQENALRNIKVENLYNRLSRKK
jgi:hexosaminidase